MRQNYHRACKWVGEESRPRLSKAADRSRNISTAVWSQALTLHRSSGCGAVTIKMAKGKLEVKPFYQGKLPTVTDA